MKQPIASVSVMRLSKSLLLVISILLAGAVVGLATFSHVGRAAIVPTGAGVVLTLIGIIPGLWLSRLITHGPTKQLVLVGMRLSILLPAWLLQARWEGAERNCFIASLLACYFVALPLESLLSIGELKTPKE